MWQLAWPRFSRYLWWYSSARQNVCAGSTLVTIRLGLKRPSARQLLNLGRRLRLLLGRVVEDGRAVLRAPVRALAIERGGVVQGKESVQELLVADVAGSKSSSTTSAWPVRSVQTSL